MIALGRLRFVLPGVIVSVAVFLAVVNRVLALATEHFGNDPVPAGFLNLSNEELALANLASRVYWYEVNGNPTFYYRGNTRALNQALQKFAAIRGKSGEVIFLPGPGETTNLTGDRRIPCAWYFHAPHGLRSPVDNYLTLTVYVSVLNPSTPPEEKRLAGRIDELDNETFAVRERATRDLEKLSYAAGPALEKALTAHPSAEKRRRIEELLQKLDGIDLQQVTMPPSLKVIEVKDLLERDRERLKDRDPIVRGLAVGDLGNLAADSDRVIPTLLDVLDHDKHEYVRRCVAGSLSRLGRRAERAVPLLHEGLEDRDENIRNAFRYALERIQGAKDEPVNNELVHRRQALREQISKYRISLGQRGNQ